MDFRKIVSGPLAAVLTGAIACGPMSDESVIQQTADRLTSTFSTTADAYVRNGSYATTNYGTDTELIVKLDNVNVGYTRNAYVRFDISAISGTASNVKLRLYGSAGTETVTVQAFGAASGNWTETGIDWNDQPGAATSSFGTQNVSSTAQWSEWDVTAYVNAQRSAGATSITFVLEASNSTSVGAGFNSRDSGTNAPQLVVSTTGQQPPSSGATSTKSPSADAYVRDGSYAANNFGSTTDLVAKLDTNAGYMRSVYLTFDTSSVSGSLSSGKLRLFGSTANAEQLTIQAFASASTSWTESGITWNNQPGATGSAIASTVVNTSAGQWYEWDVTSYVSGQRSAGKNVIGLVVKAANATTAGGVFNSREAASNTPQLVLQTSSTGGSGSTGGTGGAGGSGNTGGSGSTGTGGSGSTGGTGGSGSTGGTGGTADTTPPTVAVTAPQAGSTVSGSVTISANASDNVGVAGVKFFVDGAQVGAEAKAAPYTASWATTSSANGNHNITAVARDSAGNQTTCSAVSVTVTNASPAAVAFPLGLSSNKQYLVDKNGNPFFLQGDTPWELIQNLSQADITTYLSTRSGQGYNGILVEVIEHLFTPQSHSPHWVDVKGNAPFTATVSGASCPNPTGTCLDLTKPNEAYFQNVDWVIQQAQAQGFVVFLTPAYLGSLTGRDNDTHLQGWMEEMIANGLSRVTQYGVFLGQRYKNYPNIIWVEGGDYTPSTSGSPSEMDLVNALANGIISGEGGGAGVHMHTAHFGGNNGGEAADINPSWLSIDSTYTAGSGLYSEAQRQTTRNRGIRPTFLIESRYENEKNSDGSTAQPLQLRSEMYQPVVAGEFGFNYGCDPVWFLGTTGDGNAAYGYNWPASTTGTFASWKTALNSPGARWASFAGQLFRAIAWNKLVADTSSTMLVSGNGTGGTTLGVASDGSVAVAYFTQATTATINMARMAGTTRARWYDPSAGTYSTVSGSPFANSGNRTFTSPGSNSGGDPDWVLLLQSP